MENFVGIIGGLGPKASSDFIAAIIDNTDAEVDQDHINFKFINHSSIPDRSAYILDQSNPNPLPFLLKDIEELTSQGASFIVIPCNTAHYFYDKLQESTQVPIINMVAETIKYIQENFVNAKNVGILATEGTIKCNIYQNYLNSAGLNSIIPNKKMQGQINELIFNQVKKGLSIDQSLYIEVLEQMYKMGCDIVILACTELSVVQDAINIHGYQIVDSQHVLVEETIKRTQKKLKNFTK